MKRTIAFLLSLVMLLVMLPACGETEKVPETEQGTEQDSECTSPYPPPAVDVAKAISAAAPDEPEDGPEVLDDQLEAYMDAAYGLTAGEWDDCAVLRAAGVRAYEIAVVYLPTYEEAERVGAVLSDYLNARKGAFAGYAPEQAALVENGKVCLEGGYFVGLFICEDSSAAAELFAEIIDSGVLPETEEEPKTEPEPEPEPEWVPTADEPDMEALITALMTTCREEIDEINDADGVVAIAESGITGEFEKIVEETYGLAPDLWTDGFIIGPANPDGHLFEIAVFRMADEDAVHTGWDVMDAYWASLHDKYSEWKDGVRYVNEENSDAYHRVGGAVLCSRNRYLAFFLCDGSEDVSETFRTMTIDPIPGEEAPVVTPIPQNPPEKITDDVSFVPVSWKDAEGDPDPDHPGRILFTMPENEFMTLTDTSAIVEAWQSGDSSGLSREDKAVYDNAKEVLDEIIQDGMTDFEKEVEIYDWVLRNVDYDYSRMDVLEETARAAYTPYGGLVNRAGVCLGYASTFQLLGELAGLECITVIGAGQNSTEEHAWNMVKLNGEWYCVDLTWEYSFYEAGMENGREWRFFNTTSDYMARTGHQWDYDNIPEAAAEDHGFQGE